MISRSGIYRIDNKVSGKFYIGSTANLRIRKNNHFSKLRKQKHANIHLQNSFNKHGELVFEFSVVEECLVEDCLTREQFYIDTLKPTYNIQKIADRNMGSKRPRSEEAKRKTSEALKGRVRPKEVIDRISATKKSTPLSLRQKQNLCKRVLCISTGVIYESRKEVSNMIGVKDYWLGARLRGQQPNNTGYSYL